MTPNIQFERIRSDFRAMHDCGVYFLFCGNNSNKMTDACGVDRENEDEIDPRETHASSNSSQSEEFKLATHAVEQSCSPRMVTLTREKSCNITGNN
jgi:hypothetical protein